MKIISDINRIEIEPCVATIGFFDGVHLGHRYLIEQVKEQARLNGLCSALITFPVHPRKVMQTNYQPELLSTLKEKKELLSLSGVDYCFMLDFTPELSHLSAFDFMKNILKEKFKVQELLIGYDHRFGHNRSEGFQEYWCYGEKIGMRVTQAEACIPEGMQVSSSMIRHLLQDGDIPKANHCLGYDYYIEGTVIDGYKVGRTIGFPTANLKLEEKNKLIPCDGVYAVRVLVAGKEYMGMLDIGHRPTLNNGAHKSIEVNILDFSSDIYNQTIRILFVRKIRSDIKFPHIDELITQLHQDAAQVRKILTDN